MTVSGTDDTRDLLALAVRAARAGGGVTLGWFGSDDLRVDRKADGTPVTDADRAAEEVIRGILAREVPADTVVGEEGGTTGGTSGRRWFIDPVDGTKAFTRGVPLYATLVACWDTTGAVVGVIHCPALGETVAAARGLGCTRNGRPCRVSEPPRGLRGAWVMTSALDHWPPGALDRLTAAGAVVRTWGDAYGYALVATGRAHAMVDPEVAPWDVAPMPVILAEAAGTFTDLAGRPGIEGGSGVAAHPRLVGPLRRIIAGAPPPGDG